ncbi:histidinol dehydrogenase [Candidatus Nitrosopumilus sediminis]|uniref:Histidinol dehydrogenase n=1 Tax=Candidatus Nitrosopumilus sediminis TaxID=1229909 RepID=K0BAG6_9ARCH|nr:histidinol dehydrogenase [Candidatus Nitrosopumilus sediminis]AFS81955.1 histidinol dehydrogenase [Candidatus Nitrosopumilus sediminis]
MRIIKITNVEKFAAKILPKQPQNNKTIVESILKDVKKNGDTAIKKYEKKFSKASIPSLRISKNEIKNAYSQVSKTELDALRLAKAKLGKTESTVKSLLKNTTINQDGIKITKKFIPIQSVGCYIPGGLAKYPSSVIMSVVPAKIAGVKRIVVVSPPNSDGKIDPLTIVSADICGADEIYKTGGVQSIAALSYGTKSIPKVDKIVGPGGAFVTAAKSLISDQTGIDMLAGPTELGIIADNSANPKFVALDLISQAEHSNDTFCYLITTSQKLAISVNKILSELIPKIQRGKITKFSLKNNGFIGICKNNSDMIKLANILAPEHLQIMTKNPKAISSKITASGLVLIGNNTPSSASDYILGSNHILPTNGFGKIRGPLSVLDFIKVNTQISSSKKSLSKISKHLQVLTKAEGLPNHYKAVRGRLN